MLFQATIKAITAVLAKQDADTSDTTAASDSKDSEPEPKRQRMGKNQTNKALQWK